jgi:hypothetical protein
MALTFLHSLKIGDKFLNVTDSCIYKVVSEAVDGLVLCADDYGFGELFDENLIVRPIVE